VAIAPNASPKTSSLKGIHDGARRKPVSRMKVPRDVSGIHPADTLSARSADEDALMLEPIGRKPVVPICPFGVSASFPTGRPSERPHNGPTRPMPKRRVTQATGATR
jgi:hypothetical protein